MKPIKRRIGMEPIRRVRKTAIEGTTVESRLLQMNRIPISSEK